MWHVLAQRGYRNVRLHSSDFGERGHYGNVHHPHSPNSAFKGIYLKIKRTRLKCHIAQAGAKWRLACEWMIFPNENFRFFKQIKKKKNGTNIGERTIWQYHYTGWPDHGVPDHPLPVLSFIRKSSNANPPDAGPIVVHCRYNDYCNK